MQFFKGQQSNIFHTAIEGKKSTCKFLSFTININYVQASTVLGIMELGYIAT